MILLGRTGDSAREVDADSRVLCGVARLGKDAEVRRFGFHLSVSFVVGAQRAPITDGPVAYVW
jgi:hypothetical protein